MAPMTTQALDSFALSSRFLAGLLPGGHVFLKSAPLRSFMMHRPNPPHSNSQLQPSVRPSSSLRPDRSVPLSYVPPAQEPVQTGSFTGAGAYNPPLVEPVDRIPLEKTGLRKSSAYTPYGPPLYEPNCDSALTRNPSGVYQPPPFEPGTHNIPQLSHAYQPPLYEPVNDVPVMNTPYNPPGVEPEDEYPLVSSRPPARPFSSTSVNPPPKMYSQNNLQSYIPQHQFSSTNDSSSQICMPSAASNHHQHTISQNQFSHHQTSNSQIPPSHQPHMHHLPHSHPQNPSQQQLLHPQLPPHCNQNSQQLQHLQQNQELHSPSNPPLHQQSSQNQQPQPPHAQHPLPHSSQQQSSQPQHSAPQSLSEQTQFPHKPANSYSNVNHSALSAPIAPTAPTAPAESTSIEVETYPMCAPELPSPPSPSAPPAESPHGSAHQSSASVLSLGNNAVESSSVTGGAGSAGACEGTQGITVEVDLATLEHLIAQVSMQTANNDTAQNDKRAPPPQKPAKKA